MPLTSVTDPLVSFLSLWDERMTVISHRAEIGPTLASVQFNANRLYDTQTHLKGFMGEQKKGREWKFLASARSHALMKALIDCFMTNTPDRFLGSGAVSGSDGVQEVKRCNEVHY